MQKQKQKEKTNMKEIATDCGFIVYDDNNNFIGYKMGWSGNGYCFKDSKRLTAKCYIPEYYHDEEDENGIIPNSDGLGYTFGDICDAVEDRAEILDLVIPEEKVLEIAEDLLNLCDWQAIETFLIEYDLEYSATHLV